MKTVKSCQMRNLVAAALVLLLSVVSIPTVDADVDLKYSEAAYDMSGDKPRYGPSLPKDGPVIVVYAETGAKYSHIADAHSTVDFTVEYTARCDGRKEIERVSAVIAGVKETRQGSGGGYADGQLRVRVPYAKLSGANPVAWCNDRAKTLSLEKNMSTGDIAEKGVSLRMRDFVEATVSASCQRGIGRSQHASGSTPMDLWVHCKAKPNAGRPTKSTKTGGSGAGPGETRQIFSSATIGTRDGSVTGKCPYPMRFDGSISASGPGTIEYQFVGDGGYEGPKKTLKFDRAGTSEFGWTRQMRLSDSGQTLGAGGDAPGSDISGWMALTVIYKIRNDKAFTRKTWTSERVNFTVDCLADAKPKPARAKKPVEKQPVRVAPD